MSKSTWRKFLFIFMGSSFILFQNFTWNTSTPSYLVNAIYYPSAGMTNYSALYRAGGSPIGYGVTFTLTAGSLKGVNANGSILFTKALFGDPSADKQQLVSDFDLNGDGVNDAAIIQTGNSIGSCVDTGVSQLMYSRSVTIYSGANGNVIGALGALNDTCLPINGGPTTSLYRTWAPSTIHFGTAAGFLGMAPQYYGAGWFLFASGQAPYFLQPGDPGYANYAAASLSPQGNGLKYLPNSQPMNGVILSPSGNGTDLRYLTTSSGRIMQYAPGSVSTTGQLAQLISDSTFNVGTDQTGNGLVGRTYGLLSQDPLHPQNVYLVGGASVQSLYQDLITNTVGSDSYAGLERRLISYDLINKQILDQRLLSYAHDNSDANRYYKRILYPATALIPGTAANGVPMSQIIYNLYRFGDTDILAGGRSGQWEVHIGSPGALSDQTIIKDFVVWDVVPLDANTVDILMSPIDTARPLTFPSGFNIAGSTHLYYPKFETQVYQKTTGSAALSLVKTISGAIPYMAVPFSNRSTAAASSGSQYPSLRSMDNATHTHAVLVMQTSSGSVYELNYDWYSAPPPSPVLTWHTTSTTSDYCSYNPPASTGTLLSGTCSTLNAKNYVSWNNPNGPCTPPTYTRQTITQTCSP